MRKLGLVLLAIAAVGSLAQAQIDFNIMGTGARARGMGGAFIGVADDATAVGWNPAGLAQLDKPEASAVGLFNMKKFTYEFTVSEYPDWNEEWDESVSHIAPAFASLVLPTKMSDKNLVFAVAYQRLIDMGEKSKVTKQDYDYFPAGTYNKSYEATGGLDAISPACAVQLSEAFSLGAAANIYINGTTEKSDYIYVADNTITDKFTYESKFSGFNLNAGALVSLKKVNIGAMFRFPYSLKMDLTETNTYTNLPTYGSGTETSTMDGAEFSMPMMLGFGVAVKPTDKLTLAGDFEMRQYSNTNREYTYNGVSYTDTLNWENCNQFRVGMEYIFSGNNAVFPVRLGFRTDPRVYTGMYGDGTDTSQVVGKVFTGGFGLVMGKLMLDLAYELTMANHVDAEFSGVEVKADEKSHNIMASAIIHF
jgi:long-subunit fatty acid transport protein